MADGEDGKITSWLIMASSLDRRGRAKKKTKTQHFISSNRGEKRGLVPLFGASISILNKRLTGRGGKGQGHDIKLTLKKGGKETTVAAVCPSIVLLTKETQQETTSGGKEKRERGGGKRLMRNSTGAKWSITMHTKNTPHTYKIFLTPMAEIFKRKKGHVGTIAGCTTVVTQKWGGGHQNAMQEGKIGIKGPHSPSIALSNFKVCPDMTSN